MIAKARPDSKSVGFHNTRPALAGKQRDETVLCSSRSSQSDIPGQDALNNSRLSLAPPSDTRAKGWIKGRSRTTERIGQGGFINR
jgi:hypothetical protein